MPFTKLKIVLVVVWVICFSSGFAFADIIDFEDLYTPDVSTKRLPNGYHGFRWSANIWAININEDPYRGANWKKGTIGNSSIYGGFDYDTYPVGFTTLIPGFFDFKTAYITSVYAGIDNIPASYNVNVEGWENGVLQYTQSVIITDTKTEFTFDYTGIDTLWFKPEIASQIIIDNIQYSRNIHVPEPSSMVLFGFGILFFSCSGIGKNKQNCVNQ